MTMKQDPVAVLGRDFAANFDPAVIAGDALHAAFCKRSADVPTGREKQEIDRLRAELVAAPADTLDGALAKARLLYGGYGKRLTRREINSLAQDVFIVLRQATA